MPHVALSAATWWHPQGGVFFWDQQVDLGYFKKIKDKYSDWKHEFMEKHFNPESKLEAVDLEF